MRRCFVATVVFLCLVILGPSQSQGHLQEEWPPEVVLGTPIFVSTYDDQTILAIDSKTGDTLAIYEGDLDFYPEDIVVGPDGMVYVCDSQGDRIFRMDQALENAEVVYDFSEEGGPQGPEGPSFGPSDDLYFNTRSPNHSGIWKIPGIASIPFEDSPFPAPVNVFDAGDTGSVFGEGTAWTIDGRLLVVDRTNQRILRSDFAFSTLIDLTGDLNVDPFGVAVNSSGDIFVAKFNAGNIERFLPDGTEPSIWASFDEGEGPYFIEFDASDNLYVTTSGGGGMLQKVDPYGYISTIAPDLGTAVGVAVPATQSSETEMFSPGNDTQLYDFGSHNFEITNDVDDTCYVTVTEIEVTPDDLAPRLLLFPGSGCVLYSSKSGRCVVYRVSWDGADPNLPDCFTDSGIFLTTKYYAQQQCSPAFLHDPSSVDGDLFTENILTEYLPGADPSVDPGMRGRTDDFQDFVAVNLSGSFGGFLPPLRSDGSARFKSGRTIPVKFRLSDCSGDAITDAVVTLSVTGPNPNEPVEVKPAGKSNQGDTFRAAGKSGQYIYNLKTKGYPKGPYTLTVSSNLFTAQSVEFQIR